MTVNLPPKLSVRLTEAVRHCVDDTALLKVRLPGGQGAARAAMLLQRLTPSCNTAPLL